MGVSFCSSLLFLLFLSKLAAQLTIYRMIKVAIYALVGQLSGSRILAGCDAAGGMFVIGLKDNVSRALHDRYLN